MSRNGMRITSAILALIVWAGVGSASATYSALDLGTLGGISSVATSLNSRGFVVGWSGFEVGTGSRAFLWKDGVMTNLGVPDGMYASAANDVNARGQVVGDAYPFGGEHSAFFYENGAMTILPTLGGVNSYAFAISDRGEAVGMSALSDPSFRVHACLWRNGEIFDLGTLGENSEAKGINERGEVVGGSVNADGKIHAFLWRQGAMIDLGTLGGDESYATDINNFGVVVGRSTTATGEFHAFVWQDGHMTDLGALGGIHSQAEGINDRGQIVGYTVGVAGYRAFLWESGTMTDLGTLGGALSWALKINQDGWIAGYSHNVSGETHATLWVPSQVGRALPAASLSTSLNRSGLSSSEARAVISRNSRSSVTLSFVAPHAGDATVRLFDVSGRLVREVWSARSVSAGTHEVTIDGRNASGAPLPSGVYLYLVGMRDWLLSGKVCLAR